jgi:hypothetical protein
MATTNTSQVRIVARIRPAIGSEGEDKMVVKVEGNAVSMPNPKNEKETFTFPFHAVYGTESDQASIFSEGAFSIPFFSPSIREGGGGGGELEGREYADGKRLE